MLVNEERISHPSYSPTSVSKINDTSKETENLITFATNYQVNDTLVTTSNHNIPHLSSENDAIISRESVTDGELNSLENATSTVENYAFKEDIKPIVKSIEQELETLFPHHYSNSDGTGIPVFTPTWKQFRNFNKLMKRIEIFGKEAGLAKVIPPKEWNLGLVNQTDYLKDVIIKKPITQTFEGGRLPNGAYRQTNIENRRNYTVNSWFEFCNQNPPPQFDELGKVKKFEKLVNNNVLNKDEIEVKEEKKKFKKVDDAQLENNLHYNVNLIDLHENTEKKFQPAATEEVKNDEVNAESSLTILTKKSTFINENLTPVVTEPVDVAKQLEPKKRILKSTVLNFDPYKTGEGFDEKYCEELERYYWKYIIFKSASYGADLMGSLFENSKSGGKWNLNRLDNLLNKIEAALPGVNVPYLYFGSWKSTFAWHVEDMDLYSINYIHFGAPKQWYVVSPKDAAKFERYSHSVFSSESQECSQFLRHKAFVISPKLLAKNDIFVHKLIHRAGEFMITYPKGYHQGYNLGFNCAESVNFALESWVDYGMKALYCKCISDSVKIDVKTLFSDLSKLTKLNIPEKREGWEGRIIPKSDNLAAVNTTSVLKMRGKNAAQLKKDTSFKPNGPRCAFCIDLVGELYPTDKENFVGHEICAKGIPELTFLEDEKKIVGFENIPKSRWKLLKCDVCKNERSLSYSKEGCCIQCIKGKCVKAYHVTCAKNTGLNFSYNAETNIAEIFCPTHNPETLEEKKSRKELALHNFQLLNFVEGKLVIVKVGSSGYEGEILNVDEAEKTCEILYTDDKCIEIVPWQNIRLKSEDMLKDRGCVSNAPAKKKVIKAVVPKKKVKKEKKVSNDKSSAINNNSNIPASPQTPFYPATQSEPLKYNSVTKEGKNLVPNSYTASYSQLFNPGNIYYNHFHNFELMKASIAQSKKFSFTPHQWNNNISVTQSGPFQPLPTSEKFNTNTNNNFTYFPCQQPTQPLCEGNSLSSTLTYNTLLPPKKRKVGSAAEPATEVNSKKIKTSIIDEVKSSKPLVKNYFYSDEKFHFSNEESDKTINLNNDVQQRKN
ncbi:hypothetical protein HDU92_007871 [Lobulomyces angularis]|nr:hypothetical protein HDU92_007871 [Lobulomyces angularis]